MIQTIREDVCKLYAKATPFYIRDLHICGFWYPGGPGTNPPWILKNNCIPYPSEEGDSWQTMRVGSGFFLKSRTLAFNNAIRMNM